MRSVILLCALMTTSVAFAEPAVLAANETKLEVEAIGEVSRPANRAELTAQIETTGMSSQQAAASNAALAAKVEAAIVNSGLVLRFRSPSYRVETKTNRFDRDAHEPRILGYLATKTFEFEIKDLGRIGELIDLLASSGASSISNPNFDLKDRPSLTAEARAAAVRLAQAQAENYASATGLKVARILRLSERSKTSSDRGEDVVVTGQRAFAAPRTRILPGDVTVSVTLYADFVLVRP